MWDFSGDEAAVLLVGGIVAALLALRFYIALISLPLVGRSLRRRILLALLPILALAPAYLCLAYWADARVAGHTDYITLFLVAGFALLFASLDCFAVFGISIRDDALDRDNPAALAAIFGTSLALGIIYAGANVGGGPTIWTTLFPAFAAIVALIFLRFLLEVIGWRLFEAITIDRDTSSGLRVAGVMIGCGIILARAAGGVWVSWEQTWNDFLGYAWPALPLTIAAGILHRAMRPSPTMPWPDVLRRGLLPALVFAFAGVGIVVICFDGLHPWNW